MSVVKPTVLRVAVFFAWCMLFFGFVTLCAPQAAFASGAQLDDGTWHAYNAKDKLMKKTFKLDGWTYYPDRKGVLRARSKGSKFYYANGTQMPSAHVKDFKCLLKAEEIVVKITKKSDSMSTKRLKAFKWVMKKGYAVHRSWNKKREAWPAVYAWDHFKNINGDCHSDGAAFAYLAAAIGYKNVYVCNDSGDSTDDNHAWAMIGKGVYDPLFAQVKSWSTYYGATSGSYLAHPAAGHKFAIPQYNATKYKLPAGKVAKSSVKKFKKNGLVKRGGAYYYSQKGTALTNVWIKVKGKQYFFGKNGKAATGSYKVTASGKGFKKGAYYVFDKKGVLQKGAGEHEVSYKGKKYLVNSSGKALSGWRADKHYADDGELATGLRVVSKKMYVFDKATGACNRAASAEIQAACKVRSDFAPLRALLEQHAGKLVQTAKQHSCETVDGMTGDDIIYNCCGTEISTFKASNGTEYLMEF